MHQIAYTPAQRKQAYRDLIAACPNRADLPRLLDKAAKLYGVLKTDDLIALLAEQTGSSRI